MVRKGQLGRRGEQTRALLTQSQFSPFFLLCKDILGIQSADELSKMTHLELVLGDAGNNILFWNLLPFYFPCLVELTLIN